MFVVRYDLRRRPDVDGPSRAELYAAAVEQAAYCDAAGFDALILSEHHAVPDGYLPSPLIVASAFAAVTSRIYVTVAALQVPLHDPVRLAEDIAVLDNLSGGRVSYVLGLGYRPEEYALFERDWAGRGAAIETSIETLLALWRGEPVERGGMPHRVTPEPLSSPHPMLFYGGGSKAAARRAGRLGLGFYPQVSDPALAEEYADACRAAGHTPGIVMQPPPGPGTVFCAHNPDEFWDRWGEYLAHDAHSYADWHGDLQSAVRDRSADVQAMRHAGVYAVLTPEELIEGCRSDELGLVTAHPLCGGLPPEASWESLRLLGDVVIPALRRRR